MALLLEYYIASLTKVVRLNESQCQLVEVENRSISSMREIA